MTTLRLVMSGGFTIYILILCSVISIAIILERYFYYRSRSGVKRAALMAKIRKELADNDLETALKTCKEKNTPFSNVVHAGLSFAKHTEKEISNNMERTIVVETNLLEKRTTIVGTIGSTAVYIGLFGTVLGIMRAFNDIGSAGSGGINVVMNGISESLICTAAGLCVAIPAVMAYNYFIKRIDNFITDMELCASETMDLVKAKAK
jgi:biopolymer transport protein ExbB/TolQ